MAKPILLSGRITEAEYVLAKYKTVLEKFPDCIIKGSYYSFIDKNPNFVSKSVNTEYTNLKFESNSWQLSVYPYCVVPFEFNGNKEEIIVRPSPQKSILARINRKSTYGNPARPYQATSTKITIKFARLAFNLKHNAFDDKMLNDCRVNILEFIKSNPGADIDKKYLEPRLKKLLAFT